MSGYVTLARQSGLMAEMGAIAHNVANLSTTGYRREGPIFAEFVQPVEGRDSVSIAHAHGRMTSFAQGALTTTGGPLDLAIEGEGFFLVQTPQGERLTRAGAFGPDADGFLVTPEGHPVLDDGGSPLQVPLDAGPIGVAADGTVSAPLGPVGRIAVVMPEGAAPRHVAGTLFAADATRPAEAARLVQGALEQSNVDPVLEIARMIEVQRAYEAGAAFLDQESERRREAIRTLTR
ncbi:MAG: flagellar hook-basal body complex protein [Hasllibacter sp.]